MPQKNRAYQADIWQARFHQFLPLLRFRLFDDFWFFSNFQFFGGGVFLLFFITASSRFF